MSLRHPLCHARGCSKRAEVENLEHFKTPVRLLASLPTKANPGALLLDAGAGLDGKSHPPRRGRARHAFHAARAGIHRPRLRRGTGCSPRHALSWPAESVREDETAGLHLFRRALQSLDSPPDSSFWQFPPDSQILDAFFSAIAAGVDSR